MTTKESSHVGECSSRCAGCGGDIDAEAYALKAKLNPRYFTPPKRCITCTWGALLAFAIGGDECGALAE